MTQHTPTPWNNLHEGKECNEVRGDGKLLAFVLTKGFPLRANMPYPDNIEETRANTAFIVKAVNNHEKLVSALKNCIAMFDEGVPEIEWESIKHLAREAIKAAA